MPKVRAKKVLECPLMEGPSLIDQMGKPLRVGGWAVAAVAVVLVVMGMARTQSSHQHRGLGRTCLPYKSRIL